MNIDIKEDVNPFFTEEESKNNLTKKLIGLRVKDILYNKKFNRDHMKYGFNNIKKRGKKK